MAGTIMRIKGIKRWRHPKSGIWYTYHRASGTCIEPPHAFGTPEFLQALEQAQAKHKGMLIATKAKPGTFGAAVRGYKQSSGFLTLRDRTRRDYEKVLLYLRNIDDMPIHEVTRKFAVDVRDKAFRQRKRRFANYVLSVISIILNHAIVMELIEFNPVMGIKNIRKRAHEPEANVPWTDEEKQIVLDAAPIQLKGPIAMARWLGLRQGDIVKLPKTARRGDNLTVRTSKTGKTLVVPICEELKAILDEMPAHDALTFFATSKGKPWSQDGFRSSFFKLMGALAEAGKVRHELTFHGLRTSFAQEAATEFDERAIADALAHSDTKTTKIYIRDAVSAANAAKVVARIGNRKRS